MQINYEAHHVRVLSAILSGKNIFESDEERNGGKITSRG